MWVPAGLVFAAGGLAFFAAWLRESGRRARFASYVWMIILLLGGTACRSQQQILTEQEKALTSLKATASAIGNAWLAGQVPAAYARTAFNQTRILVEKQRTELTGSPELLADPTGAMLSQEQERVSRVLALLEKAVNDADTSEGRARLAAIAPPWSTSQ
jgi:hypothetical protein